MAAAEHFCQFKTQRYYRDGCKMVVGEASINNIMGGIENTGIRMHNHKKKLKQRFDIIKKLGQGTYGKVQLGINKETGQEVAIKTIKKSKIESEADLVRIRREIQIMSSVQHPNIIHIYEVFENREKMVLVMEYAAGGELYDYLSERKVLEEEEARRIFRQIATACYYCHKHKICHRDLKLENILLDENNNAKIADFGLSNVFDDTRLLSTFCGSPLYASPEIVRGTPYHGPEVDCWSMGVLLYTLVYGAMPFDGSNFKRLVKQISQGDYFEPQKPSPASPLIKEMLTVNPRNRANIEKICAHWWVNEGYEDSCLDISEELANQTPVRLDLLLSLAPPPPQLESEKLVVTGEVAEDVAKAEPMVPTRSQSVGSLIELTHPAERRIKDLLSDDKVCPKRKLETTVSTDRANLNNRKDKIIKENTVADITVHGTIAENASMEEDANMVEEIAPLEKSATRTITKEMDAELEKEKPDLALEGAACAEILQDSAKKENNNKNIKVKRTPTVSKTTQLEGINEVPSIENILSVKADKENTKNCTKEVKKDEKLEPIKKKIVKKKVLADKNENATHKAKTGAEEKQQEVDEKIKLEKSVEESKKETSVKSIERRKSKIFETAEKFQNLITSTESKSTISEKPKKIVIPGVSVGGFKKEFERKASLTSTSPPKIKSPLAKKLSHEDDDQKSVKKHEISETECKNQEDPVTDEMQPKENRKEKVKNAVNIISSALDKDGARKSKSRPCMYRKPPVPFGASGRSASGSIGLLPPPLSPTGDGKRFFKLQVGPNDTRTARVEVSTPEHTRYITEPFKQQEAENKTSSAEITLKSATLPRRKTTKAEIKLDYPVPKPATMEFKTEMAHRVEVPSKLATQRSEITFPVSAPPTVEFRASSMEPDIGAKASSKERIIPIALEKTAENKSTKEFIQSPPVKSPSPRTFQTQKSSQSQRSESLSRQSTQESDSETTVVTGEPIRKSPREFIIPIAVEGGGYVTPRAGSLEPSETASSTSTLTNRSNKFNSRARRMNSLLSDRDGSEDESPFVTLHRHSSFGRDSDTEDSRRDAFHMHRLRSSRPRKSTLEHNDSVSSGEEDDDDAFETLTAENLFSTLLSRVRNLTQQLNVEDGGRPGFPSSRLFSHFDHGTNFFNLHNRMDPLSRYSLLRRPASREDNTDKKTTISGSFTTPWRRSVSRDLASDIDSVFREGGSNTATHTTTLPRGDNKPTVYDLNLSDLDLKKLKLSDEDALALSYLTPGLSKRIQQQLLAQLAPSEAKKLSNTLLMRNRSDENNIPVTNEKQTSVDRLSSTLPRRFSVESPLSKIKEKESRSFLPVKSRIREEHSPDSETKIGESYRRPTSVARSYSLKEPKTDYIQSKSPESNKSERSDYSYSGYGDPITKRYSSGSLSPTRYSARYSPESSSLTKYISPSKYLDSSRSYIPNIMVDNTERAKSEIRQTSSAKRISRFLRPDFFETPKEINVFLKEKKEREMETQKVLKEIRDKRIKNRINARRERSRSRDGVNSTDPDIFNNLETDTILKNVSDNIKNLESTVQSNVHNYVNLPAVDSTNEKDMIHNYVNVPALIIEDGEKEVKGIPSYVNVPAPDTPVKKERVSKLIRPKSYPVDSVAQHKNHTTEIPSEKDIKSKIGRLKKGITTTITAKENREKTDNKNKFLQSLEKKITKLRSLSSTPDDDSDEKEKKAVIEKKSSVENAIKRLREQSLPRNLEHITESGLIKRAVSVEDLVTNDGNSKALQASRKSVTKILGLFKRYEERDKKKSEKMEKPKKSKIIIEKNGAKQNEKIIKKKEYVEVKKPINDAIKPERPKSLLCDQTKHFQRNYSGAKSDTTLNDQIKPKPSKLPVNSSFRRSLNLDNTTILTDENVLNNNRLPDECNNKQPDRRRLKLELTKTETPTSGDECINLKEKRNSSTTPDDSSTLLSPCDDNMSCDSWSLSSDYRQNELISPVSPNGYVYSGDESESVIDRIRRKSFYCRFNEKKRPRKSSYKDLELYKDLTGRKLIYRTPTTADSSYLDYKNRNVSPLNDGSSKYQTYNPRIHGRISSLYADSEDANFLDDIATGKSKKYSTIGQPSIKKPPTSVGEQFNNTSSKIPSVLTSNRSPTPQSPI